MMTREKISEALHPWIVLWILSNRRNILRKVIALRHTVALVCFIILASLRAPSLVPSVVRAQSGVVPPAPPGCTGTTVFFSNTTTVAGPDIGVTPTALNFGGVSIDFCSDSQTLTERNTGDSRLRVTNIRMSNPQFDRVGLPLVPFNVDPGDQRTLRVRFCPTAQGSQSGKLTITSDDPDEPTVTVGLFGEGLAPDIEVPTGLDFGPVMIGQSADRTLTVRNTGQQEKQLGSGTAY
jgi:hypothetical protein